MTGYTTWEIEHCIRFGLQGTKQCPSANSFLCQDLIRLPVMPMPGRGGPYIRYVSIRLDAWLQ